jgi:hypothetical protein
MRTHLPLLSAVAALLAVPAVAPAAIVSVTNMTVIAPPPSVTLGSLEGPRPVVFQEAAGFVMPIDRAFAITQPGTYTLFPNLGQGVVTQGTVIDVYFVHLDPVGSSPLGGRFVGSITFDQPILGAVVLSSGLDGTDPAVGAPGTAYPAGLTTRGIEFDALGTDSMTLSADRRTLSFDLFASTSVDQFRIVVATPEPGSVAAWGLAVGGVVAVRRLRRRAGG